MGGLGGADGQPGYHSPNIGGSVSLKRTITEANGGSMPKVVRSSISHQKLGLSALDSASQVPRKQAEDRGPERLTPWGDARPVHVGKGKALWLRFDGDRTELGYRN